MTIHKKIAAYHGNIVDNEHHRYRSWEHCYSYFRRAGPEGIAAERDEAALRLGFYLASWGMYRGSGFLLQHSYTVHLGVIDCLAAPCFTSLWAQDFGAGKDDQKLAPIILQVADAIGEAYSPFGQATDTLVTKIILGTLGCLPACDRYFISGFKNAGFKYSSLNDRFVERISQFSRKNLRDLRAEQRRIKGTSGIHYPFMKLLDMYFWQIGYELETKSD